MKRTTIFHSDMFDLVSYGNGMSYALHDNATRRSIFLQGDDASDFRDAIELFETKNPEMTMDDILAELTYQFAT